jgi:hypothetical protein
MRKTIFFLLTVLSLPALGQVAPPGGSAPQLPQLQSPVPVSPAAAAIAKYGEVPVGYYTGIPSVSIPVYTISTGKLQVPVSLNYHAGGIRVEEIPTPVGLGWSLAGGGVVTRQTRGIPDDAPGGFIEDYPRMNRFLRGQMSASERISYLEDLTGGTADGQPDLFSFSAAGLSGQFMYDTTGQYITIPFSKVKIEGDNNGWVITGTDGSKYYFFDAEITTAVAATDGAISPGGSGLTTTTSWYLTKIVDVTGKDSINFYYTTEVQRFTTLASQTRYVLNAPNAACPPKEPSTTYSANTSFARKLQRISFRAGEIKVQPGSTRRLDMTGDNYAIDHILVRSTDSSFYKKVQLHHSYLSSAGGPSLYDSLLSPAYYRLCLDSVSVYDRQGNMAERYGLGYKKHIALPARNSFDQDHWGYYNQAGNLNLLVPTTTLHTLVGGNNIVVNGANRNPHPLYSQACLLDKLTYPTGGYTTFAYEPNQVRQVGISQTVVDQGYAALGSIVNGALPFYTMRFVINNNSPQTVVTTSYSDGGCSGGLANVGCPLVSVVDSATGYTYPITGSYTMLLPNGVYTLQANLSGVEDSVVFNSFGVSLSWPLENPLIYSDTLVSSMTTGGVRIKQITHYNNDNAVAQTKTYDYNLPDGISSGTVLSMPSYIGYIDQLVPMVQAGGGATTFNECRYLTISSGSNYPLTSTHGVHAGYSRVREFTGISGEGGYTEYRYNSPKEVPDINQFEFPFPPSASMDWQRGMPVREKVYAYKAVNGQGVYYPLTEKRYQYAEQKPYMVRGVKAGIRIYSSSGPSHANSEWLSFETRSGWYVPVSDTTISYDPMDSAKTMMVVTAISYDKSSMQPDSIRTLNSTGEQILAVSKYPGNKSIINNPPLTTAEAQSLDAMAALNLVGTAAEVEQYKGGQLVVRTRTGFAQTLGAAIPLAATGYYQKGGFAMEPVLRYTRYDERGNVLEARKENDVPMSYLWGYASTYPVAEVKNALHSDIAFSSFETNETGGWIYNGTTQPDAAALTGSRVYNLSSGSISKNNLSPSLTYTVSYWSRGGSATVNGSSGTVLTARSGWTLYQHTITNATTLQLSGAALIDEVRLHPKEALMSTYCYQPLVGVSSQCSPYHEVMYYYYDSLGRLVLVKDQEGKVLKSYQYRLQQ